MNHFFKKTTIGFMILALCACQVSAPQKTIENEPEPIIEIKTEAPKAAMNWHDYVAAFSLNIPNNQRIDSAKAAILKHPHYVAQVLQHAQPYLPFIIKQLKANHLPVELALLPFIESNYKIKRQYTEKAAGLWQFMPITAKAFALEKDKTYDARLDVIYSTKAAIAFLKQLNADFNGDWLLTLAAYNSGAGTVRKAIRRNEKLGLKTNYWALSLPQETMNYVPKFLAIVEIVKHAEEFDIALPSFEHKSSWIAVQVKQKMSLTAIEKLLNVDHEAFIKANPAFLSNYLKPNVPIYVKEKIFNALDLTPLTQIEKAQYVDFSVPIAPLESIKTTKRIYEHIDAKTLAQYEAELKKVTTIEHKVKAGETLGAIAQHYHVKRSEIIKWNQLKNPNHLKQGQSLILYQRQ